jgi:hypothetical protein
MSRIFLPSQPGESKRRSHIELGRSLLLAFAIASTAVACDGDDISSPPTLTDPASAALSPGETPASVRWNEIAQYLTGENLPSQGAAVRIFAYVTLAQHLSVEAVADDPGVTRPMMRGAVAGASAPVLIHSFPVDSAAIDSIVRAEEASLPATDRAAFRSAEAAGRLIGAKVVARAQSDGFNATWNGTVPIGPGRWSSSSNPPTPPILPLAGTVVPFFLSTGRQFRPSPPPDFDSPAFRDALAEVRRISDTRTAMQDSLAKFWVIPTGSLIAGYWNTAALELISRTRLGERAAAHALALMNTATQDALIACHDAKYTYWLIRPSGADTAIRTSVGVPNHPSYPSNHSCLSGASANVLGSLFPMARERLQAKANEAALSRLYGGLHFRFDMDAGLEIARKLSAYAIALDRRGHLLHLVPN